MLGGPLERSGFPPPADSFTPPRCGLFLLRRSQFTAAIGASGHSPALLETLQAKETRRAVLEQTLATLDRRRYITDIEVPRLT